MVRENDRYQGLVATTICNICIVVWGRALRTAASRWGNKCPPRSISGSPGDGRAYSAAGGCVASAAAAAVGEWRSLIINRRKTHARNVLAHAHFANPKSNVMCLHNNIISESYILIILYIFKPVPPKDENIAAAASGGQRIKRVRIFCVCTPWAER